MGTIQLSAQTPGYRMMGGGGMMGGYGYGYGPNSPPYTTQPGATPSTQYYQPVYPFMYGGSDG